MAELPQLSALAGTDAICRSFGIFRVRSDSAGFNRQAILFFF